MLAEAISYLLLWAVFVAALVFITARGIIHHVNNRD
jgi:hypothetical protein